jgi:cellulose synthase/poly-beta-1,6-N-acetylglucosamine synthase-like glycosyltransferase
MLLPLLIILLGICVQFILAGIVHFSSKNMGLEKDYSLQPTVTVLIACFNEGEAIYKTIESVCKSDYPNFEVRVFDDRSTDDSFAWMQKAEQDFSNVIATRNEVNLGKGRTIIKGLAQSSAEIVITIDSDTIIATDAMLELTACFADSKIALVGGSVGISNPNKNALTAFQVCVYYLFFHIAKIPEAYFHCIACVSGCLSATRRTVFLELVPDIEARGFFGSPVRYGEDRFITHQTLLHGYDTYCNLRAKCWTPAPDTIKSYWAQQLRWARSGMGDFFRTVRNLPTNVKHLKPLALYNCFFSRLMVLVFVAKP